MSKMQAKVSKPKQVPPDRDRLLVSQSPLTFDTPDFECPSSWRFPSTSVSSRPPSKGRLAGRVHTIGSQPKMAKVGNEHRTMSISSDDSSGSSIGEPDSSMGLVNMSKGENQENKLFYHHVGQQLCLYL